jgi:hypothetical protein
VWIRWADPTVVLASWRLTQHLFFSHACSCVDLKALRKLLNEAHRELSTFDVYKSEIESKHLQWGLVHSVVFFRENAKLLEGSNGDFDLVKVRHVTARNSLWIVPYASDSFRDSV